MRCAASRRSSGTTWVYVLIVMAMWECPRISITTRGDTPCTRSNVAQEWRKSWNRRCGKPARSKKR